jgi:hypothetical protein
VQNKQQTPGSGKGFSIDRVNQVSADATAEGADIALGMFYIRNNWIYTIKRSKL